ncbi:NERD domain-containing protein kinase family protein [Micromonospora sp. NPDC005413]|uniref:NERD domain-containing protein kinase family protein n=1 Tax=Micromonospora sp. NPDC005413 TaxID=3154563 RepID=UPI0033B2BA77
MREDRCWTVTPWRFSDEPRAIEEIHRLLPDEEPYRTWSHFSFVADSGHVHSVDLLVATPTGLCLVEVETLRGQVRNVGGTWLLTTGGRTRAVDSPRRTADIKAAHLSAVLGRAAATLGLPAPVVHGAVYLPEPSLDVDLTPDQAHRVYGPDPAGPAGLPRLHADLLSRPAPPEWAGAAAAVSQAMPELLRLVGCAPVEDWSRIGTWQVTEEPIEVAPAWQDYTAWSTTLDKVSRLVRVYVSGPFGGEQRRALLEEATLREHLLLRGLRHPGIVEVVTLGHHRSGPALLMHQELRALRLDHFLALHGAALDERGRAGIIRQLGEALAEAHAQDVQHTALSPWSVVVTPRPPRGGTVEQGWLDPRIRITGWHAAGLASALASQEPAHRPWPADRAGNVTADLLGLAALARAVQTGRVTDDAPPQPADLLPDGGPFHPSAGIPDLTDRLVAAVRRGDEIEAATVVTSLRDLPRQRGDELRAAR